MTGRAALLSSLLSVLGAGCAEMPASAGPAAVPVAAARRPGAWQQFCEQAMTVPQASALVAARGADGWELVAMYNGVLCYKRPAPPPAPGRPATPGAPLAPSPGAPYVPAIRDPGF